MKKLMQWMFALAVLPAGALLGQSLVGNWQGTLKPPQAPGRELRIVIKVTTTDADGLKAVMYSIDQGAQGAPASAITLQGSTVKMSIPGVGGTYEGTLDASGSSITGAWTQGPANLPLNLARASAETAWEIPMPAKPMAADANPSFEVATVKPSRPEGQGKGFRVQGRRFTTLNTSVSDLITFAYDLHARQISGGPGWIEVDKFDVAGEPDTEGVPNPRQLKLMIQKLLADRFQLTFHRDKKELSVYALTVAKAGPKLTKNEGNPNSLPSLGFGRLGQLVVRNASMADFTSVMQTTALDRPVVDQTGLAGRFDFTLNWTPDEFQFAGMNRAGAPPAPENGEAPPDLYTAIQQQIGLKLESMKAPAEVLVIDRVQKPSEN
jgi:uncharacterized protein (TIGR03435 family)